MNKIPMKGASAKAPKMGRFRPDEAYKPRKADKASGPVRFSWDQRKDKGF